MCDQADRHGEDAAVATESQQKSDGEPLNTATAGAAIPSPTSINIIPTATETGSPIPKTTEDVETLPVGVTQPV